MPLVRELAWGGRLGIEVGLGMGANVHMDQQLFGSGNRTREEGVDVWLAGIVPCGNHYVEVLYKWKSVFLY